MAQSQSNSARGPAAASAWACEALEARLLLAGDLLISEFMADNTATLADEDGDYSDWIELHNPTSSARSLDGYYLSDDARDPDKWRLPAVTIPAGAYLVVFASGKDRASSAGPLHTNFSLKAEGEYLALVAPDGATILSDFGAKFPAQQADISHGYSIAVPLLSAGAAASTHVPASSILGRAWTMPGFDDSSWQWGHTGIGFDTDGSLAGLINLDIGGQMLGVNPSAFIRIPFNVADPSALNSLVLRMRFDDGFVAYLNGTRVNARNAPAPLEWQSAATSPRDDTAATTAESFDLSVHLGLLNAGENVLAVHGLNRGFSNGDLLVLPELLAQTADISSAPLRFFSEPTPGGANVGGFEGFVTDTKFSVDRGFFDAPFQVEITTATPGASIFYTTDGSQPSPGNGALYTAPILISTTTTLRARAYLDGYRPTNIDTQTYLFLADVIRQPASAPGYPELYLHAGNDGYLPLDYGMDPQVVDDPAYAPHILAAMRSIPTLSIVMDRADMFGEAGIYPVHAEWGLPDSERPASVEFIFPDQPARNVQADAGIKPHSHNTLKRSLRLLFRSEYGNSKLKADLFGGSAVREFDRLVLRAGNNRSFVNWWNPDDSTYTRDQWARDSQLAMSGIAAHGTFVHLYINGLYWGLYNPVERPDHFFAASYHGGNEEDYFAVNHGGAVSGDPSRWEYLRGPLKDKDMSIPAHYAEMKQYLDVEQFADYILLNFYAGTADWPDNNWYASGRTGSDPSPMRFYVWDAEDIFDAEGSSGPFDAPGGRGSDGAAVHPSFTAASDPQAGPDIANLFNSLRRSPEFMLLLADRANKHLFNDGALNDGNSQARWLSLNNQIRDAIIGESARWGDARESAPGEEGVVRTRDNQWQAEVDRVAHQVLPGNAQRLITALRAEGYYPAVDPPRFKPHGGLVMPYFAFRLEADPIDALIYYTTDGSDPRLPGGDVNPAALPYTGPTTLATSSNVRARLLAGGVWSAMAEATFTLSPLRASEIMYNPAAPSERELAAGYTDNDAFEYIELRNIGDAPLELAGLRLTDGVTFDFSAGALNMLPPSASLLIVKDAAAFSLRYGNVPSVAGQYQGNLSNEGEHVRIAGPLDYTLLEFIYDDAWHAGADGGGHSLTLADPHASDLSQASAWRLSALSGGSPGGVLLALQGDANQDGRVDIADYFAIDAGRALRLTGFAHGDFNDSGASADAEDYMLIDRAFLAQAAFATGPLSASIPVSTAPPRWQNAGDDEDDCLDAAAAVLA
jgi:hypothetical protein